MHQHLDEANAALDVGDEDAYRKALDRYSGRSIKQATDEDS